MTFIWRMARARDARVVAAPAVLLSVYRHRRRDHRRSAVDHPERAERDDRTGPHADRRAIWWSRRARHSHRWSAAQLDRAVRSEAGVSDRTESVETPTMVRPADSSKPVARMVELRAVQPGVSSVRSAANCVMRTYTPRLLGGSRRAGPA